MKLQLASKEDKDITTMLNKGDWGDPDSPPENLPKNMTKPDKRILSLRAQIISERKIDECKLCNQQRDTGTTQSLLRMYTTTKSHTKRGILERNKNLQPVTARLHVNSRTKPNNPTSDRNDQVKQPRKQRVPHQERVIVPLQSLLLPKLRVLNDDSTPYNLVPGILEHKL